MSVLKPPSCEMAITKQAVKTARPVAGVVKMRLKVTQRLSCDMLEVASWIEISIDFILACRCSGVEVG